MKIYLGIGGSKKVQQFAQEYKCGWCLTPDNSRDPKTLPYFLDNGAFVAWKRHAPWNERRFMNLIQRYPNFDFIVAPDIVCGGGRSLMRSLEYVGMVPSPLYLAVQDGMQANQVTEFIDSFDGIFIGGSIPWKFSTARTWADIAHRHGKKCHAGRVGTWRGLIHMHFSGIDSVDSSTATRNQDDSHIRKYSDFLQRQGVLFPREVLV